MRLEKFLFCEFARSDGNGQVSLIGFIPGDILGFNAPRGSALQLQSLTCVAVLDYMTGISKLTSQLEVRLGNIVVHKTPPMETERGAAKFRHHFIVASIQPFVVPEPGDYMFKLIVQASGDTTSFSRRLKVEVGPPPSAQH